MDMAGNWTTFVGVERDCGRLLVSYLLRQQYCFGSAVNKVYENDEIKCTLTLLSRPE